MPGSPAHLFRRFFDVAFARPLTSEERSDVSTWVSGPLESLFYAQNDADQRHGYHAARSVVESGNAENDAVVAALVHDVGKRHAELGLIGRSVASVLIILRLPLSQRMRQYRDHGQVGADELVAANAPDLAVQFARHHHGERPASIPADTWSLLVAADQPPKTLTAQKLRITSGN